MRLTAAALAVTIFSNCVKAWLPHGGLVRRTSVWMLPQGSIRARGTRSTINTNLKGAREGAVVADRIFELAGREFDIGKPSVLAKVRAARPQRARLVIFGGDTGSIVCTEGRDPT